MGKSNKIRIFAAVPLPDEIKSVINSAFNETRTAYPKFSWVNERNYHLTLKFIGDTSPKKISTLEEKLSRISTEFSPFEIAFKDAGVFPNFKNPRVVWAGLAEPLDTLKALAITTDKLISRCLNIDREKRPFKAHMTVARIRKPGNYAPMEQMLKAINLTTASAIEMDHIVLYKSTLSPHGSIYESLFKIELKGEQKN